jgi:hypothetical protein
MTISGVRVCVAVLGLLFGALLTNGALAGEICELTVAEQVGAARSGEPVRMGIPLAKGVAKEVGELALTDSAGKPLPCQFRAVMRWHEDNSLRWVHAVFQTSVPAKGAVKLKLVKGTAAASAKKVKVTKAGGSVTVENGVLKLIVKGPGFNLFDAAWFDPAGKFGPGTEIVKPHSEGFVAVLNGKPHRPGADSKLEVEEAGSECAVIRVTGRLVPDGKGADGPFTYACYVHVYAGSPVVRVSFSYTNCHADPGRKGKEIAGSKIPMKDLSLVLPTALAGAKATVGGEGKNFSGKSAKIFAKSSDASEITTGGAAAGTAKGKSTKPLTLGWVDFSQGEKGLAMGTRWFWQTFPKVAEAGADGKLRAGLYARESGKPLAVYMGQGRTHYLTFLFHKADAASKLGDFFAGTQMPLRATCTPKYYCRVTKVFGPMADADPALYPGELSALAKKYDGLLLGSARYIEKKIDGHTYGGVRMDSYGYMNWGDVFHWANSKGVKDPWNILWESNYYDYPWACLLQFARTGEMLYLDILDRHGLHLADVFMCKWNPQKRLCGACRYSPPANHVGLDTDYKNPKPYVSVEFNHHKAQSTLYRYLLLGDLRARDDFLLALNNATLNSEGAWRQARGPGAKLATLTEGYLLTRSEATMKMLKRTAAGGIRAKPGSFQKRVKARKDSAFQWGIALEGLIRYWWISKDQAVVGAVKAQNDWLIGREMVTKRATTPNAAMAMAFAWRRTGEKKYRDAAVELLKQVGTVRRPKQFGQYLRTTPYAWYYLSKLADAEGKKAD